MFSKVPDLPDYLIALGPLLAAIGLAAGLAVTSGVFLTLYVTEGRALVRSRARCRRLGADLIASEVERDRLAAQLAAQLDKTAPLPTDPVGEDLAALDWMTWTIDQGGAA